MRRLTLGLVLFGLACVGCKGKQESRRQDWLDNASACPTPSKCSGKATVAARDVTTCEPGVDASALAASDVLVVHDAAGFAVLARVREVKASGASFDVELLDGAILERAAPSVLARVCR